MSSRSATPILEPTGRAGGVLAVGDLAYRCPELDSTARVADAEQALRDDPRLRAVVVVVDGEPVLLSRARLSTLLSGRLGYGRPLLARARISDVLATGDIVLTWDADPRVAARSILDRDEEVRYDDVLVLGADGTPGGVPVAELFRVVGTMFEDIAMRDPLTGLPNRLLLQQYGTEVLGRGVAADRVGVLFMDLDGFKVVNDTLGHAVGDQVLVQFGQRLARTVRTGDMVGRLGGDEFAIILVDVSVDEAQVVADRVVHLAQTPFVIQGMPVHVSSSVGVAVGRPAPDESGLTTVEVLLRHADAGMLEAKRDGKGRARRLLDGDAVLRRHADIRRRLGAALDRGGLELHFQPKLHLGTQEVVSVEALVRWTDAELGVVSPGEFIPVAEQSGQIAALGRWVLTAACAQARRWQDEGVAWSIAINVSPVQLASPRLASDVLDAISQHGLAPWRLQVEVTETATMVNVAAATEQLSALRSAGVQVHLDDFGTGYSSLSMLRRLPLSALKIDQGLVARIDTDPASALLLAGVIGAAHAMGITVVAEGVERHEQMEHLRTLGCDYVQGYLIARPASARDLHPQPTSITDLSRR
ncbi:putative bifunctional diguanylate cyclase/phosphodiesterase [Cellulomonas aerilata]|uniref:putative bifunctional diguanylate cyclase/phosphodiesterase n=1 Tax=Cellulomonas aerilata TaxID=515326 RepID=UPI0011BF4115|nr:bifunctional diguanylate cyclase/phosphodiesterase [Cellulomonas aerilata]